MYGQLSGWRGVLQITKVNYRMEERLNLKAVDDYSDDYSSKVTAHFFVSRDRITGQDILKLCPVQQVNLFVIRELLHAWRHEGQKLHSPYFDYTHPEVAEALTKFHNLLSNHISITRENFQPLLKKAVSKTIYLIVDPYDFFSDILDGQGNEFIRTEELRNEIKYLKINQPPLEKLVRRLEEKKLEQINGNEAFGLLDQILEEVNFTPEDVEHYLGQFSAVIPLSIEKLYEKKSEPVKAITVKNEPVAINKPKEVLHQESKKDSKGTLAENFQKIGRIKDNLTINQKFMFTKILFNGDFEIFTQAIDRIDSLDNLKQAVSFIEQNYSEWDKESEEYEEFMELLEKRFH
jgi:hypothetical protein